MLCKQESLKERKKYIYIDKNFEKPKVTTNYCNRISNFEPDMTLRQNSAVFIVFGTATPSVKNAGLSQKVYVILCYNCGRLKFTQPNWFTIL